MNDLINRRAAMNAFAERVKGSNNSDFVSAPTWNDAVEIIEKLPNAERHGHWIESEDNLDSDFQLFDMSDLKGGKCSECGYEVGSDIYVWNYCPNCGADMRGEHDG